MAHVSQKIDIRVPLLARVEGEGALEVVVEEGKISHLAFKIFEPPRLFEKFLEGREAMEVPDMVARICGICPVAYQMSAVHALEPLFGLSPTPWVKNMRRVFYCGEWIQSHALHIHLLALPDFLGFAHAVDMARRFPAEVKRGLRLQGLGNKIMAFFGARAVHPLGMRLGGFWRAPKPQAAESLRKELLDAIPEAQALLRWTADLPLQGEAQEFVSVSTFEEDAYPMIGGEIAASDGKKISVDRYEDFFQEIYAPHSTAFWSKYEGKPYLVGPLARMNLFSQYLPLEVREILQEKNIRFPQNNMFFSVIARAAEILFALIEAAKLLEEYALPERPYQDGAPKAGVGMGASEAPRGLLWHRYEMDGRGLIQKAKIVPPTSQNQARMEDDLRQSLMAFGLDKEEDAIRLHAEMVVRNYDPCISCATHFLRLELRRA